MNAIITNNQDKVLVTLNGRLDTTNVRDFEKQIAELYAPDVLSIEIDCADFTYISSSGLRILLTLQKSMTARKGSLVLLKYERRDKRGFRYDGFFGHFYHKIDSKCQTEFYF